MRFLSPNMENKDLMILHVYYDQGTRFKNTPDDVLNILYKDIDTGSKYVETIKNPKIEIYILEPKYRNFDYIRDYVDINMCVKYTVPYKSRYEEAAKILNINPDVAKFSPYLFQADIDITHFYMIQFQLEYGNDRPKHLLKGFLDIENDIINITGFPEPGETPINCVTYLDSERMQAYTLVLDHDNLPVVDECHKKYKYYEGLRSKFRKLMDDFIDRQNEFISELNESFDDVYGKINYNILIFKNEIDLIVALFKILNACENDFIEIWNAPYDVSNLIERPKVLGYDPDTIIPSDIFGDKHIWYRCDENNIVHKRKHIFNTFTKYIFSDQMVNYSGIRSGRGKLPSVKLNAIGRKEIKDEKIDYSEYGNIRMFPYFDLWKFIKYNIKDVLLQKGIEYKTNDLDTVYATIEVDCVLNNEVFTSTKVVLNSFRKFIFGKGKVMGANRNKLFKNEIPITGPMVFAELDDDSDDSDNEDEDEEFNYGDENKSTDKEEKYAGALVMCPQHMSSSGYKLFNMLQKFIHDHVIDMDIGSEYPTAINIMNASNETLIGRVFINDEKDINIPFYDNFYFVDSKDEKGYAKVKVKSNLMMEHLSQNDYLNFGNIYLNLPSIGDIYDDIDSHIEDFMK